MGQYPKRELLSQLRLEHVVLRWSWTMLLLAVVFSVWLGGLNVAAAQTLPSAQNTPAQSSASPASLPKRVTHDGHMAWVAIVAVALAASILGLGVIAVVVLLYLRRHPPQGQERQRPVPAEEAVIAQEHDSLHTANEARPAAHLFDVARVTGQESIAIQADEVALGRSRRNVGHGVQVVSIPIRTVGRRHAAIEYRNHAFVLVDKGSVNGTLLNGERIQSPTVLHDGDQISLESVVLTFCLPVECSNERTIMIAQSFGDQQDSTMRIAGDVAAAPFPRSPKANQARTFGAGGLPLVDTHQAYHPEQELDIELSTGELKAPEQWPAVGEDIAVVVAPGYEVPSSDGPGDEGDIERPSSLSESSALELEVASWFDIDETSPPNGIGSTPPDSDLMVTGQILNEEPPAAISALDGALNCSAQGGTKTYGSQDETLVDAARPQPGFSPEPPPPPSRCSVTPKPNAWLRDLDNVTSGAIFHLDESEIIVGRVDGERRLNVGYLIIRRTTVGRKHAALSYIDGRFYVEDFRSVNGTLVNGERVVKRTPLTSGDIITFDEFRFMLEFDPDKVGDVDEDRTKPSL